MLIKFSVIYIKIKDVDIIDEIAYFTRYYDDVLCGKIGLDARFNAKNNKILLIKNTPIYIELKEKLDPEVQVIRDGKK